LIDLNYIEEGSGAPNFILALLPNLDQIVLLESSSRMHVDHLDKMIESATSGCKDIYEILNKYVKTHVAQMAKNFSNLI
jgi:exosome complex component RRP41